MCEAMCAWARCRCGEGLSWCAGGCGCLSELLARTTSSKEYGEDHNTLLAACPHPLPTGLKKIKRLQH